MEFSENLKTARKKAGLTQDQLAEGCGLATITIRQYECKKREPRYATIKKIAEFLNVSVESLIVETAAGHAKHVSSIGENIRRLRIEHGMTQEQLAVELNTTKSAISKYELNMRAPRYETVDKMASIFRTTTGQILNKRNIMNCKMLQRKSHKDAHLDMSIDSELLQTINSFAEFDGISSEDEVEKLLLEYTDILLEEQIT